MTIPSSPIIRNATLDDAEAIRAIYNDAVVNTTAVFDYEPRSAQAQIDWLRMKAEQKLPVLVAETDGAVLGYCSYGPFRPWPAYLYTVENAIYVAPEVRGKGIGKALLGPLLQLAKDNGLHTVIAGITAENEASLRLHRAFGYEPAGTIRQAGWKFERWLDLVFLQKML
ncbi:GNAT family N-acetyltransferase [uncultured Ferrovibrio sp.]|jgi:L-amino acid N-acyltransferase YncA|uniref:GNAT family N-acetyltransferase n=1 Tax=uncultured Ferrovibrio sp. TaxID=1576913 RepID=UPI00262FFE9A|nr:GNAT family N-acetyltransferase [uncultured Ferrovibrio sp.]